MRFGIGIKILLVTFLSALGLLALSACNDHDKAPAPPAPPAPPLATYTIGGTVSGLAGSITLANKGSDSRTLTANGAFTFATAATSRFIQRRNLAPQGGRGHKSLQFARHG